MPRVRIVMCLLMITIISGSCKHQKTVFIPDNPLPVAFGDPFVLKTNNKYYLYGTTGGKAGFEAYSSDNLKDWKPEGDVYYGNNTNGWGNGAYWAPEVYEKEGKYYMFYSAQWKDNPNNEKENFKVGVAVANNPLGPFTDLSNKPIFDPGYPIIDANVYFENGKAYLYYSRCCYKHAVDSEVSAWAKEKGWYNEIEESWIYGVELKPDFSGIIGQPVVLLKPPVDMNNEHTKWESRSVLAKEANRRWNEGSVLFKDKDVYYMMYSANHFAGEYYAIGYATAQSPLGPFTKSVHNPVLEKNNIVTGTGHNSIIPDPDGKGWLCIYHGRTEKTGNDRQVFIDRMVIDKNGVLKVEGPTVSTK
ncbi:glycoside hydrolase [Flavobacterium akiainvivens]|uniref:Glycoside hydrolase n=2 Tax=Flavobacterium akiainvivens TaxID=1202724 RepID=A0A0N0RR48_9FLAO|nr:glycoside hydrolase [Flavobacterium akiainvivens]